MNISTPQNNRLLFFIPCLLFSLLTCLASNAQNAKVVLQSGTDLIVTGTLVLTDADLVTDGLLDASAGTVVMAGTANSTTAGSSVPMVNTLTMNKTSGSMITLNNDLQVSGLIDFQNGKIDLNGQTLSLTGTAILQSETDMNRITGITGGEVTGAAAAVNNPNQLNIANLGAMITTGSNLGNVTISRTHLPAGNAFISGIQRTYLIQPQNNAALNATLRFYYFDGELNGQTESTLTLWKSGDGITWVSIGFDTRDMVSNYVEKTGLADFSYWTLADANNPLPVSFVYFKAHCADNYVLVEWETASETNTARFELERSDDGNDWKKIAGIKAMNRDNGGYYSFKDMDPRERSWYRLRIVDRAGTDSWSPIFSGGCADIGMPLLIYPNPAEGYSTARLSVRRGGTADIRIYDLAGALVYDARRTLQAGVNTLDLPVGQLAAGTYQVKVLVNDSVLEAQLIKL